MRQITTLHALLLMGTASEYHLAMGSIEAYQTAKGRRYRVIYRRPNNFQTQKRGFATKRSAELFLAEVEVSKSRGSYIDPSRSRVTLSAWMDDWMNTRSDWKPTSRERVRGIVELHAKPKLGDLPLGEATSVTSRSSSGLDHYREVWRPPASAVL